MTENERAYDAVLAMIRTGEFRGGEPLRESSLATRVGVSRTPIREALRRLAAEGLVELRPNRGATLIELDESEIVEIFNLRSLLEPYAAARAADNVTCEQLDRLTTLLHEMDSAIADGELDELASLNNAFHGTILKAAKSRVLRDATAVAVREPLVQRTFYRYTKEQLQRSQQHHYDLVAALSAKNPAWAESVMRAHLEGARSTYI